MVGCALLIALDLRLWGTCGPDLSVSARVSVSVSVSKADDQPWPEVGHDVQTGSRLPDRQQLGHLIQRQAEVFRGADEVGPVHRFLGATSVDVAP